MRDILPAAVAAGSRNGCLTLWLIPRRHLATRTCACSVASAHMRCFPTFFAAGIDGLFLLLRDQTLRLLSGFLVELVDFLLSLLSGQGSVAAHRLNLGACALFNLPPSLQRGLGNPRLLPAGLLSTVRGCGVPG